jgi:hypothetical protein
MRPGFDRKLHSVIVKIVRFSKRVPNPSGISYYKNSHSPSTSNLKKNYFFRKQILAL